MDERWHVRAVPVPGGGEPVDWWVADGRLRADPVPGARELPGGWLAPGLVDAHAHLTFDARGRLGLPSGSAELMAAQLALHREVAALGRLGVRGAAAIAGATGGARRFLGLPGLESGAPADLVTFDRDPAGDIAALGTPVAVVAEGR